jgi:hypothetical protein
MTFVREAPLRYVAVFCVEADSREAFAKALEYVVRRLEIGKVVRACGPGPSVCVCKTRAEWDGERLTVRSCMKRAVDSAAKLLAEAYGWFGGRTIRLVKCERYMP